LALEQAGAEERGIGHGGGTVASAAVSVSVEPKRAELPLPGGREGATVRLHPLLAGEMSSPPGLVERPDKRLAVPRTLLGRGKNRIWLPVPAFLIEHPGAGPILIDTGLHPSIAIDPKQNFGRLGAVFNDFRMEHDQAIAIQLRARGVAPADVSLIVMTHLHWDHASGVSEFPDATFVLDGREWEAAIQPRGAPRGYRLSQFDYPFDWRSVDYEDEAIDSFETFGAAVDLFGDGSVRLLSTPGHTLGHQSVLLRLRGREALLCGDAAYLRRTIDDDVAPLLTADEHLFQRSLKEIRRFVERTPGLVVVPGHDREEWPKLESVYD
jgi:glyoxylase-like metal-dependent hydrolase (beta-lactamase superfamily II)